MTLAVVIHQLKTLGTVSHQMTLFVTFYLFTEVKTPEAKIKARETTIWSQGNVLKDSISINIKRFMPCHQQEQLSTNGENTVQQVSVFSVWFHKLEYRRHLPLSLNVFTWYLKHFLVISIHAMLQHHGDFETLTLSVFTLHHHTVLHWTFSVPRPTL